MDDFLKTFLNEFNTPFSSPVLVFSVLLLIVLIFPLLLKKINIPGIIGLIIAGVFIGPYGLNMIEKNSAIDLFSTIGLLYIMFIAGLELDLNEFIRNKNKSIVFGLFTFVVPLAIGFPVCYYFLDYSLSASLLIASMFSTHTLVAYPIVSRLGIAKNQAVVITVGGTILTDTAVLINLAVIIASVEGGLTGEFWIKLLISLAIFLVIMFLIIPPVSKWFFRKLDSERHLQYIFVLSVVFFAAFLAEISGIEPIIGAFLAGLALNRLIPHSSALMNRIEFIGNSLFIPFFLISVGMIVDTSVLLKGPHALIIAVTLTVVAIIGKYLAAFFTQIIFSYSNLQRRLIFGLSSSHAAATLAVILLGYKAGILDENVLNGTIILVLVTCIVASFVSEKAARAMVLLTDEDNYNIGEPFKQNGEHILLPIANMENMEWLLDFAVLIKNKKSSSPVTLLSVVSNNDEAETNILKAKKMLEACAARASASETKANVMTTIDYNVVSGILRTSREILADVIILGWPRREGVIDKLIGEKTKGLVSKTDKTTLICHFEHPLVYHKKLIVIMPPLAEHENGFVFWFTKVSKLAFELSLPITIYGSTKSKEAVIVCISRLKITTKINYHDFDNWDDITNLTQHVTPSDFFIFISARKGAVSHLHQLDNLPNKTEKFLAKNSRIIIYPQQNSYVHANENYENIDAEPLTKGLETIQKIGKEVGHILKKGE